MKTRSPLKIGLGKLALCLCATNFLPPAGLARAEEAEPLQQPESAIFLKLDLKYLPVDEFLPMAVTAVQRAMGGDAKAHPAEETASGLKTILLAGETLFVANPQLNRLTVSGSEEHLDLIDDLANEIDVRPRQVYIKAFVVEVTLGDDIEYGFDALPEGKFAEVKLPENPKEGIDLIGAVENPDLTKDKRVNAIEVRRINTTSGAGIYEITRLGGAAVPPPGDFSEIGRDLEIYLTTVAKQSDKVEITASPFVFASNNKEAFISPSEGLEFTVTPLINSSDEVTLQLKTELQHPTEGIPDSMSIQSLCTTVRISNRGTFASGGIIQKKDGERKELLFFFHPWFIPSEEEQKAKVDDDVPKAKRVGE